ATNHPSTGVAVTEPVTRYERNPGYRRGERGARLVGIGRGRIPGAIAGSDGEEREAAGPRSPRQECTGDVRRAPQHEVGTPRRPVTIEAVADAPGDHPGYPNCRPTA